MNWNRKDKEPIETLQIIKEILEINEINTKISSEMNFKDLWFSNRIEFADLNGKGTNGKGITYEYALASGYAEFMERLQTRLFFKELFFQQTKEISKEQIVPEILQDIYIKVFKEYLKRNSLFNIQTINQLIQCKDKQYGELQKYYDYDEKKIVYLPERFIFSICGSNGLCAGNTKYEAFCQGICEIFERYVNYKLYFGEKSIFPTIERQFYEKLNSYSMITALESKGYNVYVKDCTLGGRLPVLGVLVINHSKTKYCFRLGSDINLDICIQRCITEMFQGADINSTFRLHMKDLDDCDYCNFWKLRNNKYEYYKSIRNGSGKIPRYVFLDVPSENRDLEPFVAERLSNEEVTKKIYDIAKKSNMHIYIKDYSYLGFDTLGIYVPGFSEIIDYDYGIIDLQNTFKEIREMIRTNNIDIARMNILLNKIVSENLISADFTLSELLGVSLKYGYHGILTWNIYLLLAWLNVLLRKDEESELWLDKYHDIVKMNKREARIEKIIFQAILSDIPLYELEKYLNTSINEKEKYVVFEKVHYFYSFKEDGMQFNICKDCNKCELFSYCDYPFLSKIKRKIDNKYMNYEKYYNYTDNFYQ